MMNSKPVINYDTVLELILSALNEVVNYELAVILRLTDTNILSVQKALGVIRTNELKDYTLDLEKRRDLAGIMERREPYLFSEGEDHLDTYHDILDLPGDHSCLVVPLMLQDEPVGMMTLDHRACNMFSANIVRFISTISKLISITIVQTDSSMALLRNRQSLTEERNLLLSSQAELFSNVIGSSRAWNVVIDQAKTVAASELPVLLQGETGTGKEEAARLVHKLSDRSTEPFIALNCSALNLNLAESELFGHEKGAFTSAAGQRKGRFELAHGGTLFLDEIGDLPMEIQPKLLRALQEGKFERVGSEKTIHSDVRIIAASHVDLNRAVSEKKFREDLYYRLGVFPIFLPPLREREDDLFLLAEHFMKIEKEKNGYTGLRLSPGAAEKMADYNWPGNVRELQNVILRASLVAGGGEIKPEHLVLNSIKEMNSLQPVQPGSAVPRDGENRSGFRPLPLDDVLQHHIGKTLSYCGGRIYGPGGAAEILGMKPTTLQSRMKKMGIPRK